MDALLDLPGVNFSSLLVRFSIVCDVIPLENDRGTKHSLQPALFSFARVLSQTDLPAGQSGLSLHSEARLHLYLKSPGAETMVLR